MTLDKISTLSKNPRYVYRKIDRDQDTFFSFFSFMLRFFFVFFTPISLSPSLSSVFLHICLLQPPLSRLQENSPLCSQHFLSPCSYKRNGERSKKGLGRNGGALCPEFVPRRSPCSFTRDDKSGVALTLYPLPFFLPATTLFLPTRRFYSRLHAKLSRPHLE